MAVRREQVVLDLTDNLTPGLARAAVAAGLLDRELKSLGGSSTSSSRELDKTAKSTEKVGTSSRRAGPEVDHMSGRLRIMADAAVTLGPALIPLGASTIPVLTAALAGLGSAAGAIGVTVLAFKGLGNGLKALDKAQLEPTAANIHALRLEMEKLGPAGAEFVHFLDGLEPQLKGLQGVARAGIFPGVEAGITDLLTRLPEVRKVVNRLSLEMGDLAREAGASLASDSWTPFFNYVKTDARPTLDAFAHSTGNVALGVANLLVAFAPLSRDFTGGLEDATAAFAEWSKGLDDNQSFQDFLEYVSESGPQVIDFLGALGAALSGLVQAAAPFGQVVLPALTGMARVFALIAKSPIGPGLYAAAAGMVAFNRASLIAEKSSARFSATWSGLSRGRMAAGGIGGLALLASSLTDVDDKAHLANTTLGASAGLMVGGPWGLAIGAAVGQVLDLKDAYTETASAIEDANDAMRSNDAKAMRDDLKSLQDQLDREHPKEGTLANYMDAVIGSFHDFTGQTGQIEDSIAGLQVGLKEGGDVADLFGESIGQTGDQLRLAAGDAQSFSGALAVLNGWFDKRAAVRNYKDAIDTLAKSMKDGFSREDAGNLDAIGTSILQVAQNIKSPKIRGDFLAGARAQLEDMAKNSGPKAAAAIQEIIDKFDSKGLTHPIAPKVDTAPAEAAVSGLERKAKRSFDIINDFKAKPQIEADDTKAQLVIRRTNLMLDRVNSTTAKPKVTVDPGNSLGILDQVANLLGNLHDRTIRVNVLRPGTSVVEPHASVPSSSPRVSPRRSQSGSPLDKMTSVQGLGLIAARGGSDGIDNSAVNSAKADLFGDSLMRAGHWADDAATGLRGLKAQLDATQKAFDKAKQTRDDAVSRRDSLSGTIQSNLAGGSIWDATAKGWGAGFGANTPQGAIAALNERKDRAQRFVAALNTLKQKGVTGAALQEILSEGLEATEAMAAADLGTLSQFSTALNDANTALAAAGLAGGNAVEGANVAQAQKAYDRMHADLQEIKQAVNQASNDNKQAHKDSAAQFTAGVNGGASNGHRKGH